MKPYSEDLRRKILAACDDGDLTRREVAALFHVGVAFVQNVLRGWRETGQLAAKPPAGGYPPMLHGPVPDVVAQWVAEQPDLTLAELRERRWRQQRLPVSASIVCRALQRLDLPRKNKVVHASERDTPRVHALSWAWWRQVRQLDPWRLIFVDESGVTRAMPRLYGRAPRG